MTVHRMYLRATKSLSQFHFVRKGNDDGICVLRQNKSDDDISVKNGLRKSRRLSTLINGSRIYQKQMSSFEGVYAKYFWLNDKWYISKIKAILLLIHFYDASNRKSNII